MSYLGELNSEKPIRPVFKVLAILLAIVWIPLGLVYLIAGIGDMIIVKPFSINKSFILGLVSFTMGCHLVKKALAKKKEKGQTLLQGKNQNKYLLLWEAIAYIISPIIIYVLFKYSPPDSGGWTMAIMMLSGLILRYFPITTEILKMEGYSPYLSLTFVFPLALMVKMAITGKHK
ncbi:MAG: hypothetical protein AB1545_09970 [Thermodesulfobacteriota bacterium]